MEEPPISSPLGGGIIRGAMDNETKDVLLGVLSLLQTQQSEIVKLRRGVDIVQHIAAGGDAPSIQWMEACEDKASLDSLNDEARRLIDAMIGKLQRVKVQP